VGKEIGTNIFYFDVKIYNTFFIKKLITKKNKERPGLTVHEEN